MKKPDSEWIEAKMEEIKEFMVQHISDRNGLPMVRADIVISEKALKNILSEEISKNKD